MGYAVVALVSYLIGSIPSGFLIAKLAGVDIRQCGSGNIGATNVTRTLGKRYGYPVFLADFGKGLGAVSLSAYFCAHLFHPGANCQVVEIFGAIFCVIGNAYPVWLRFRGGKGVSTSAGAVFALAPLAMLISLILWILIFKISRYVSLASVIAALALPLVVFVVMHFRRTKGSAILYFAIFLAVIVVLRHRSNLSRLLRGTEQRFEKNED